VAGLAVLGSALSAGLARSEEPLPDVIEFNRDIRPLLADRCFQCHGPDPQQRQADLRLDEEAGALAAHDGRHAVVRGQPTESELFRRITAADPDERMPPAEIGRRLSSRDIGLIQRWIEQGAKWQGHWAFLPPRRPEIPVVKNTSWSRGPLDQFVLARLEREGLSPAPEADRATLLRRVTLDLTGLPPSPDETAIFLTDPRPDAYERAVDRLLASPRYGERMANRWLDAARYADTSGYQSDGERQMFRYRDWVIESLNRNQPFDEFTVEQLAGDLLPNPTLDQRIATGFNRNHRGNAEGGIIPEEFAVEYVVDRVETTATVWLALTMGCSRCHDHKYDPLSQREFYQFYAYFNNIPEFGRAIKVGNSPPYLLAPNREQQRQLAALELELGLRQKRWNDLQPALAAGQRDWEQARPDIAEPDWAPARNGLGRFPLDGTLAWVSAPTSRDPENNLQKSSPKVTTTTAAAPRGTKSAKSQALATPASNEPAENEPAALAFGPGVYGQAAEFDGRSQGLAPDVGRFGFFDKFSFAVWVFPQGNGTILSRMQAEPFEGYDVVLHNGQVQVHLVKRWLDDAIRLESKEPLPRETWSHLVVTYDGSRLASGVKIYLNGRPLTIDVQLDELNQTFELDEPFRLGSGANPGSGFHGRLDDLRIFATDLTADEAAMLAIATPLATLRDIPASQRKPAEAAKLRAYYLDRVAAPEIRQAFDEFTNWTKRKQDLLASFPTVMVMEERPTEQPAFVLNRGQYDLPGERVRRGVPAQLPKLAPADKQDRLTLARWLIAPDHPLTARVAVNRFWQMNFGTGLVKSVDDFGSQGDWPSHPELLDWLATEFVRTGWDVKAFQRMIVTSATYRQSSRVSRELWQRDPENRLLARGPRQRLSAEMLRDQALAASGLLVEELGGPSVKTYQPPGLWEELSGVVYQQDHGSQLYRRSLYLYWKRTSGPPVMLTFDASTREFCTVRESRTNTPLQALAVLNETAFVEAARVLAQKTLQSPAKTVDERLAFAFRRALAREPRAEELTILRKGFEGQLSRFRAALPEAEKLIAHGEFPRAPNLDPAELAAYTTVANLLFNLDEFVTKE